MPLQRVHTGCLKRVSLPPITFRSPIFPPMYFSRPKGNLSASGKGSPDISTFWLAQLGHLLRPGITRIQLPSLQRLPIMLRFTLGGLTTVGWMMSAWNKTTEIFTVAGSHLQSSARSKALPAQATGNALAARHFRVFKHSSGFQSKSQPRIKMFHLCLRLGGANRVTRVALRILTNLD